MTREEVLQLASALRQKLGPGARDFPISDQWGNTRTTAALLVQDPVAWQSHLTDDIIDGVFNTILDWLNKLEASDGY